MPLLGIFSLGRLLGGTPPVLVFAIPSDGLVETLREVRVDWPPAELLLELCRVDGITAIVARTVANPVKRVLRLSHALKDGLQNVDVVLLAVRADEIGLTDSTLREDVPDRTRVVLGVNPVADVLSVAIELWPDATEDVGDLPGYELLDVLVGTIVVGAVGYGRANPERAVPCAHEEVTRGLGGAVGAGRLVGVIWLEPTQLVQGEVAVDLVGRDVMVADVVLARRLEETVGADDVGLDEGLGVLDAVVVVGFRGIVHDGVVTGNQLVEELLVAYVTHDQFDAILGKARNVCGVAGIRELVEHRHVGLGVVARHPTDEVASDEAAAAGNDDVARLECFFRHQGAPCD